METGFKLLYPESWGTAMWNRTYQIRSRRGGLVAASDVIQELVERAAVRQKFYRPARRTKPGARAKPPKTRGGKLEGVQLELDFTTCVKPLSSEQPLFPEAYE